MALFMDVELVSIHEAESPDAYVVTFDVIYAGETWCRSVVCLDEAVAAWLERDEQAIIGTARNALLDLLAPEAVPVSFHIRVGTEGPTILARGTPGRS